MPLKNAYGFMTLTAKKKSEKLYDSRTEDRAMLESNPSADPGRRMPLGNQGFFFILWLGALNSSGRFFIRKNAFCLSAFCPGGGCPLLPLPPGCLCRPGPYSMRLCESSRKTAKWGLFSLFLYSLFLALRYIIITIC